MRCEIPHRCVRRKYRIRRHSPFRLRNCWEGRSVRASSLLRQLAKGGCAARRLSWVTPGFSQSRRCKTTASAKLACLQVDSRGSPSPPSLSLPTRRSRTGCRPWSGRRPSRPLGAQPLSTGDRAGKPPGRPEGLSLTPGTELEFVIMVIAVSCVKLLSAHNSTQHTSRKHKV